MAFNLQYFAQIATGQSASFAINFGGQYATPYGPTNVFSYGAIASEDSSDNLLVDDFFLPVVSSLLVGDFIVAGCTDGSFIFYVGRIVYPDNDGKNAFVSVIKQGTTPIGVIGIANGGTGRVDLPVGAVPNSYSAWDANSNFHANNTIEEIQIITAANATTTLDVASARRTFIVGNSAQTLKLPDATTLEAGTVFEVYNNTTSQIVTVVTFGNAALNSIANGAFATFILTSNSVDAAASWEATYIAQTLPAFNILGNSTVSTAVPKACTLDANSLSFSGNALGVSVATDGGVAAGGLYGAGLQVSPGFGAQSISGVISSAQLKALNTTPIQVVLPAAVRPFETVFVDSITFCRISSSVAYTAGGNLVLQYGATPGGPLATSRIPATTIRGLSLVDQQLFGSPGIYFSLQAAPITVSQVKGQELYLYVETANFATGDGVLTYVINYHMVDL